MNNYIKQNWNNKEIEFLIQCKGWYDTDGGYPQTINTFLQVISKSVCPITDVYVCNAMEDLHSHAAYMKSYDECRTYYVMCK